MEAKEKLLKFFIQDGSKEILAEIQKESDCIIISLNGNSYKCFYERTGIDEYSLIIDNKSVESAVVWKSKTDCEVHLHDGVFQIRVLSPVDKILKKTADSSITKSTIKSTMPGRVVKLFAQKGSIVKKGQPLIVIEAMKMQNEICSQIDASIDEVIVKEGDSIDSGALLIKLKPKQER